MGLVTLNGTNPFAGQVDPFIGFGINYETNTKDKECSNFAGPADEKTAVYTIDLNGSLTGCEFSTLTSERERIHENFTPPNIESFSIAGLDLPSSNIEVRVNSINFANTNYIGHIPYSISLSLQKKLDEDSLIVGKTHSMDFNIPAQGDNTISYTIGANGLETGDCQGLQRAVDWVNDNTLVGVGGAGAGLLEWNGIGTIKNPDQELILVSEGETVNRAENSYQRNYSYRAGKDGVTSVYHDYSVTESEDKGVCEDEEPALDKSYRGTFSFKSSTDDEEASGDRKKLYNAFYQYYDGIFSKRSRPLSLTYDSGNGTLSYSVNKDAEEAEDTQVIYDETLTTTTPEGGIVSYSVNGAAYVQGGTEAEKKTLLDNITNDAIIGRMQSLAGEGTTKEGSSIDRDDLKGNISYDGRFIPISVNSPDVLDGLAGLTSYRIDMTCPREVFDTVYVLGADCDHLIMDLNIISRASVSITANGTSGAALLGTTSEAIKSKLKGYVEDKKNQLASAPERKKAEIPKFTITPDGCASYSQTFSWQSKNAATSFENPATIISNLLG